MYLEELIEEKENLEHELEFAEFDLKLNNNEFTRSKVAYIEQRLANTKRAINRTKQMVTPIYSANENKKEMFIQLGAERRKLYIAIALAIVCASLFLSIVII